MAAILLIQFDPEAAAALAKASVDLKIYTVGIGADQQV